MESNNNETNIFKSNKKKTPKTKNTSKLGPEEGVLELPNFGGTRKPDNPLKGIRNLVPNIIHRQWPIGVNCTNLDRHKLV